MTAPSPDMTEREQDKLYVTDEELFRRLGVPAKVARPVIDQLDRDRARGFPPKQKLWGDRRYWPAVKAWLDRINGLESQLGAARVAPERSDRIEPPRRPLPMRVLIADGHHDKSS